MTDLVKLGYLAGYIVVDSNGKVVISYEGVYQLFVDMGLDAWSTFDSLVNPFSSLRNNLTSPGGSYKYSPKNIDNWLENGLPDYFIADIIHCKAAKDSDTRALELLRDFSELSIRKIGHDLSGWKTTTRREAEKYCLNSISLKALPWSETFDILFWQALEYVFGYKQGDNGCAQTIKSDIYRYFGEEICQKLDAVDPLGYDEVTKRITYRPNRLHQHFTGNMRIELELRIKTVTSVLFSVDKGDRKEYKRRLKKLPPFLSGMKFLKAN